MEKNKKPFYTKWWFILIVIVAIIAIASSIKAGIKSASDKKAVYTWPDSALASMISQPESKYGRISMENEKYFRIDIYKVSRENFEKYVEDCKDSGFSVDYTKYDNYYSAENEDGYSLRLNYDEKEKTLGISLNSPEESSYSQESSSSQESEDASAMEQKENEDTDNSTVSDESEESPETKESESEKEAGQSADEASGDIRPEFKEVLDEYEAFMNEYCDFMKEYANSNDVLALTADYMKLIQEEVEWLEKIDNLENEEMNEAEAKYYAEVTLRVSQKLLETAQ